MALSNMQVFNEHLYTAVTETIDQQIDLFNEASGGTIILTSGRNQGDFSESTFYSAIAGIIRRRNAYGSGTLTPVTLQQQLDRSVKVAGGTPPIVFEPNQYHWILRDPAEAAAVIGVQVAEGIFADYLNTAIAALRAAITQNALVSDGMEGLLDFRRLNRAASLFGDRASAIRAWVMHSTPVHDLFDKALENGEGLFSFGTVNVVQDGFGRRFIVTDSPALFNATPEPDEYYTLGLVEGAVVIEDNDDFFSNMETNNGKENIERNWQAEWSFNIGMKGYTWDATNGGKSPTTAALSTGTNWDKNVTYNKDTAGVLVKTQGAVVA